MNSAAGMAQGFIVLSLNSNNSTFSSKLIPHLGKRKCNLLFNKSNKIFPYVDITQHKGLSLQKSQRGRTANEVTSRTLEVTVWNICRAALSN